MKTPLQAGDQSYVTVSSGNAVAGPMGYAATPTSLERSTQSQSKCNSRPSSPASEFDIRPSSSVLAAPLVNLPTNEQ